ncbi:hypothetical protein GKE82_15590 [Conexibacter sp. W3-3-2]|uniref:GNAT family N-acetyltransferase n=1 Tax=Paraconexibacter algicola TaxID=2133960 RepID=A0A2T4UJC2_9ACTN|nr:MULTISPECIES: hypothetical protein [Solirubrobacterales]MTD45670.1 hypothetical protein [Conexibacter sp. W3-3-2]PTL59338.1 hypothetical protein C7Y72_06565 [Paraconexibacter algicola]
MRLDATTSLPDGTRVRLRLPHAADRPRLGDLLGRLGLAHDELDLARELRFDPRARTVVCAIVWDGSDQLLAGWAGADRGQAAPDLLLADETLAPGVRALLLDALAQRASAAA